MPLMGFSFAIASSTSFTDFLRPTSMGMIEFGNRTELRKGRIGKNSGISIGPSGIDFFGDIAQIVVRTEPGCDKFMQRNKFSSRREIGPLQRRIASASSSPHEASTY